MFRVLARWWAKLGYRWRLEVEAGRGEVNARLAERNAQAARDRAKKLTDDADEMDKRIAEVAAMEEKGFWLCENGHEQEFPLRSNSEATVCAGCGAPAKFVKRSEMSGQERYESDQERKEAEKIVAGKREMAKQESENATEGERAAQHLRGLASNARATAEKIRRL